MNWLISLCQCVEKGSPECHQCRRQLGMKSLNFFFENIFYVNHVRHSNIYKMGYCSICSHLFKFLIYIGLLRHSTHDSTIFYSPIENYLQFSIKTMDWILVKPFMSSINRLVTDTSNDIGLKEFTNLQQLVLCNKNSQHIS